MPVDAVTFSQGNEVARREEPAPDPPDGGLDDASAWFQSMLDKDATLRLPPGTFLLETPLETDRPNVTVVGAGAGRFGGATRLLVPDGQWAFRFNVGGSLRHTGPVLRDFAVEAAPGASSAGGVWIGNVGHSLVERVSVRGCQVGIRVGEESSRGSHYSTIRDPILSECTVGLDVADTNGLRLFGGVIEHYGGGTPEIVAGTKGIVVGELADTFRAFGTVIQFVDVGVTVEGWAAELHGVRTEACSTHIDVQRAFFQGYGLHANNSIVGGGGVGFRFGPTVKRSTLHGTVTAVETGFEDLRPDQTPTSPHDWCEVHINGHTVGPAYVDGDLHVAGTVM